MFRGETYSLERMYMNVRIGLFGFSLREVCCDQLLVVKLSRDLDAIKSIVHACDNEYA